MKRIVILMLIFILLSGCIATHEDANLEPEQQDTITEETAELASDALDLETIVSLLGADMEKAFSNYEITLSDDKKSCLVYIWDDGLSVLCVKAKNGITSATQEWNAIIDGTKSLSLSVQNLFDEAGRPDVSTSVVIRNDLNPDAVLLMAHKGRILLNAAS